MKKILLSLLTIALVSIVAFGATRAYFSDTETSVGNTFTAGTLDLKVEGQDAIVPFTVTNLVPGERKGSPTYQMCNVGTIPGVATLKVNNVSTNDNTLVEPETSAGDLAATRLDNGFTIATSGDGELLDQVYMRFWVDDTPGQRPAAFDWQDKYWEGIPDLSSYYSLPVNTDLMAGKNIVLQPQECQYFGAVVFFVNDADTQYDWIRHGIANNAAMSDDIKFDMEVGLVQQH